MSYLCVCVCFCMCLGMGMVCAELDRWIKLCYGKLKKSVREKGQFG